MTTFARVPIIPGKVLEIYIDSVLFPMHSALADTWYTAPTGTVEGDNYDGTNFTSGAITLSDAKSTRMQYLKTYYQNDLISGFTSSALGSAHHYASDALSQSLLNSLIIAGNTANYIYFDGSNNPINASHTLVQLQQVLADLIAAREISLSNYDSKVAAVNAALTINDVKAITY